MGGADYERLRRHFGPEECRIVWTSTEAFVCSLAPPEPPQDQAAAVVQEPSENGKGLTVIAGARFFSVMNMAFAPENVRHSIDDVIFRSSWDPEAGVSQWKIAYI